MPTSEFSLLQEGNSIPAMPRLNNQLSLKQRRHKRTLDFCGVYTLPGINQHCTFGIFDLHS
jgi:hypothetical protein